MFVIDRLIFVGALLLLVGIASSKISSRAGLPFLILFIGIGMAAGSEGIGGIEFANYTIAHGVGTVSLAIILFDGGLRTSMRSIRPILAPALVMATAGVVITAVITALAAHWVLRLPWLESLLLGSIVGSTDAAAVFAVLRSSGMNLEPRLSSLLEFESGSNDPMAIFLTIGLLEVLSGEMTLGAGMLGLFVTQMGVGGLVGLSFGRLAVAMINRIELRAAGLYPLFAAAAGLLSFGLAATLGGSGFLAIYIAGIVIGSHKVVFQRGILLFHDGAAWLAQISMFVLLGLLSFPSRLLDTAGPALIIAGVLIFIARPVAVAALLIPFRYNLRELAFISLAGLKGAVPIVLGTFPLLFGIPGGEGIFDGVFFVVLVSALIQGWSMPAAARMLGLQREVPAVAAASLEITSLRNLTGDIVEYTVPASTPIIDRTVRDLALPHDAVIAMIVRGDRIIPPRGSTRLQANDHVFFVVNEEVRGLVEDLLFHGHGVAESLAEGFEFPIRGSTTLADLKEIYGVELDGGDDGKTLDEVLRERLGEHLEIGRGVVLGPFKLRVREIVDGAVESVGLLVATADEPSDQRA
ncbi:MAG: potassium/proton antiporter [Longimicrobiales bacterium]